MTTDTPAWITVKEAANRAQVSSKVIYRAVAEKQLRAAIVGGRRSLRFRPEWVDAFLERCAEPVELPR
jgi:excisionase family DNA binding protein